MFLAKGFIYLFGSETSHVSKMSMYLLHETSERFHPLLP